MKTFLSNFSHLSKKVFTAHFIHTAIAYKMFLLSQTLFHAYCLIWTLKRIIQLSSAFRTLHGDFYRLIIATSIDHWECQECCYLINHETIIQVRIIVPGIN